jgi:hypothetical protein
MKPYSTLRALREAVRAQSHKRRMIVDLYHIKHVPAHRQPDYRWHLGTLQTQIDAMQRNVDKLKRAREGALTPAEQIAFDTLRAQLVGKAFALTGDDFLQYLAGLPNRDEHAPLPPAYLANTFTPDQDAERNATALLLAHVDKHIRQHGPGATVAIDADLAHELKIGPARLLDAAQTLIAAGTLTGTLKNAPTLVGRSARDAHER